MHDFAPWLFNAATAPAAGVDTSASLLLYGGFITLVIALLALDLGVFNRKAHVIPFGQALMWTAFWIALSFVFTGVVYLAYQHHWMGVGTGPHGTTDGVEAALEFLTAYVVEKSLSLDNIFVIALIFSYFQIPREYQHRVLYWGILGALLMRGAMIAGGVILIHRFEWMTYVFGVFLLLTAVKLLFSKQEDVDPNRRLPVRLVRRIMTVSPTVEGMHFFTRIDGRFAVTPLFLVLVLVESTDVIFAVDSIPAVFAVTEDPFLVFTSNVFAILGLRSLYFVLADVIDRFHYLKLSLVVLLALVAVKMLLAHHYKIPTIISLSIIAAVLTIGIGASWLRNAKQTE